MRLRSLLFPICAVLVAGLSFASTSDARPTDHWGAIVVSAALQHDFAAIPDLVAIAAKDELAEPETRAAEQPDRQTFAKVNREWLGRAADRRVLLDNGLWRRPSG